MVYCKKKKKKRRRGKATKLINVVCIRKSFVSVKTSTTDITMCLLGDLMVLFPVHS